MGIGRLHVTWAMTFGYLSAEFLMGRALSNNLINTLIKDSVVDVLKSLNIDPVITAGMCLMATMPVGNLPLIQAEKTGEDTTILSRAIAVTTVVSMITITVFMSILA